MHVHLPKPLHGWRAFVGEVAIIVLGVLIALGGEQLVESWRWHEKVGVVRTSITGELANDRARWEANVRGVPCALGVIDRLDRWAAEGAPAASAPDASMLRDRLSFFWMHSANWNLATASQALDHFPVDEQLALGSLYDGIVHREVELERETDLTERVQTLVPLASDAEQRRDLRAALGNLKSNIGVVVDEDAYMKRHFNAVGVKPDRSDFEADYASNGCVH
jgi:hypothetical protein